MAMADILKGISKNVTSTVKDAVKNVKKTGKEAVEEANKQVNKDSGALKFAKKVFKEVDEKKINKLSYQRFAPYKLNPKIAYGAIGAYGAYAVTDSIGKTFYNEGNRASMGENNFGELSNLITMNPISPNIKEITDNPDTTSKVNNNISNHGADGDIVFALHQLRESRRE